MEKQLPVYEFKFNEENIEDIYVSFVDQPAIEEDFYYFNEEKEIIKLSTDEKMIVTGPAMIPYQKIYRKNLDGYVYFSQSSIVKFAELLLNKKDSKFNIDHKKNFPNVNIIESFFARENNEFNVPVGSLIISAKVNDKELWEDIKLGNKNGFSIEGLIKSSLVQFEINYKNKNNMNLKEKLEKGLKDLLSTMFEETEKFAEEVKVEEEVPVVVEEAPVVTEEVKPDEVKAEVEVEVEPVEKVTEEPAKEYLTKEDVQSMFADFLVKVKEELGNQVAMVEEKVEKFGEELQPMAKPEQVKLNKFQEWKQNNK